MEKQGFQISLLIYTKKINIYLMVPLGEGNGLLNPQSESGMLILSGTMGFCFTGEGILTATGGSASPTRDWNDSLMFVLGKRKVQLKVEGDGLIKYAVIRFLVNFSLIKFLVRENLKN
jgi:hypothetical protein